MHTCEAPGTALDSWLKETRNTTADFGHLLLEQVGPSDDALVGALRPYFESAHRDAREYFHDLIGLDLHPEAGTLGSHAQYPGCLPMAARRGLFGEVVAGLLTEHYEYVGKHDWKVPIFLFRHHEDVEKYLFALARDPSLKRGVWGRFGSDFIAVGIDKDGHVERYLAGEAKWRAALSASVIDTLLNGKKVKDSSGTVQREGGIWEQLNKDSNVPHGLRQLQRLLKDRAPDTWSAAIYSLDKALVLKNPTALPRTNLVLIAGNASTSKTSKLPWISVSAKPTAYSAPHDLQVVELILLNGEDLIDRIYNALWTEVA